MTRRARSARPYLKNDELYHKLMEFEMQIVDIVSDLVVGPDR